MPALPLPCARLGPNPSRATVRTYSSLTTLPFLTLYKRGQVSARLGLVYARNDDAEKGGWGYELGAWRWAMHHVLPGLDVAPDAYIYMLQDSIFIQTPRAALPYPPPSPLKLMRVFGYRATYANLAGMSPGIHTHRQLEHWKLCVKVMRSMIENITDAPKFPDYQHVLPKGKGFVSVFGPSFVCR